MVVEFNRRFLKDLDKINRPSIKKDISEIIAEVKAAGALTEIKNLKKLKGHSTAYRIRVGDYRIGLYLDNDTIEFVRVADRKDIYKVFP